ncbi:hypothetical protein DPMN_009127, partial [Dreissena polymorpha]
MSKHHENMEAEINSNQNNEEGNKLPRNLGADNESQHTIQNENTAAVKTENKSTCSVVEENNFPSIVENRNENFPHEEIKKNSHPSIEARTNFYPAFETKMNSPYNLKDNPCPDVEVEKVFPPIVADQLSTCTAKKMNSSHTSSETEEQSSDNVETGNQPQPVTKEAGNQQQSVAKEAGNQPESLTKEAGNQPQSFSKEAGNQPQSSSKEAGNQSQLSSKKAETHPQLVSNEVGNQPQSSSNEAKISPTTGHANNPSLPCVEILGQPPTTGQAGDNIQSTAENIKRPADTEAGAAINKSSMYKTKTDQSESIKHMPENFVNQMVNIKNENSSSTEKIEVMSENCVNQKVNNNKDKSSRTETNIEAMSERCVNQNVDIKNKKSEIIGDDLKTVSTTVQPSSEQVDADHADSIVVNRRMSLEELDKGYKDLGLQ